jgi:hypothetical protein
MQLSEHFSAQELGVETTDLRIRSLAEFICSDFLEPIREHFNEAVIVHDGYRDSHHNTRVGGKPTSFHLFDGDKCAVDFHVQNVDLFILFEWLRGESKLRFDKIILEKNKNGVAACVHLQARKYTTPRLQAFIGDTGDGKNYEEVTVAFADFPLKNS